MRTTPQPAKAVTAFRDISNRVIADNIGYSEHHVGRVLLGKLPASQAFRTALARFLDLPEDSLFRDDAEVSA